MAMGLTHPLTEMSTRNISWGKGGRCVVLTNLIPSYNKSQRDALLLKFILAKNSTCFGQIYCPSSGVSKLYTQQEVYVMLVMLTVC